MAIRVIRKGNIKSSDHDLLVNRDKVNQHPITSISGLKEALNARYIKPDYGIPKTDLDFKAMTDEDFNNLKSYIDNSVVISNGNIKSLSQDIIALQDFISNYMNIPTGKTQDGILNFTYKSNDREDFISENGDIDFFLTQTFITGGKSLEVYRDGELLRCDVDYIEVADNHIQFLYPLEPGVLVTCINNSAITSVSPIHEEHLSIEGQTVFDLKNRYSVGYNTLNIFVKGVRLEKDIDYKEVTATQIELLKSAYPVGTNFIFRQDSVQAAGKILYHENDYQQKSWKLNFIAEANQKEFKLTEVFIPGTGMIDVTINGQLQWEGTDNDYIEENEQNILFNYSLEEGTKVSVICTANIYNWKEFFVSITNQTKFITKNPYYIGRDDIVVYENGIQLSCDDDFKELSYNIIELNEAPPSGSKISIFKRR